MGTEEIDLSGSGIGLSAAAGQLVECLATAGDRMPELSFTGIHSVRRQAGDIDAALQGTFRLRDERFELSPPVDWWSEPYTRPAERGFFQNSFVFADPLLADPRFAEAIPTLAALFVDWLTANPRVNPQHPHRYAWHDHAAAGRLVAMSFVLREGARRKQLGPDTTQTLAAGVLEHVAYLLDESNYVANHNHGLFCDAAVALAARDLRPVPQAEAWTEVVERRFGAVLNHTIDRGDAIHLEHSPYYHTIIHGALSRFGAAGLFAGIDLQELVGRMEETSAWLVAPDGYLPPIGDTPFNQRPSAKAAAAAGSQTGMRVFARAGYAVVRTGGSGLIVTAAHHPTAHKHADDGSFCLYEEGQPMVLDAGDPGHDYESAERRYGTSPAAHATICVDGFDWARESPPYGSGVLAAAERGELYALLTRNPGAVPGGGAARRVLVYAPGRFLVVIDDVEAGSGRELVRSLPVAPGLDAVPAADGRVAIVRDGNAIARLLQISTPDAPPDEVEVVFGRTRPAMGGFCFPTPDTIEPRCDIRLSGPADHPRAFALSIGGTELGTTPPTMIWSASGDRVDIEISGLTAATLAIRIGEGSVELGTTR
jgi:hypothetical protein